MSRLFEGFTNDQLYILKRQAIHASSAIMTGFIYTKPETDTHHFAKRSNNRNT